MAINGRTIPRSGSGVVAAHRAELEQTRRQWWASLLAPGPADREVAEAAVATLYASGPRRRARPRVVWCHSPLALVRAAADAGAGEDVADEVAHHAYRRELAAVAGRTTKRYPLRTHLLAELQDARARQIVEAFWDSTFDALKAGGEQAAWRTTRGSVCEEFLYSHDIEILETTQPYFVASLALAQFLRDHWGFTRPTTVACDLVRACGGFVLREDVALLSERHLTLSRDGEGRLHAENSPAAMWPDGFCIYAWHGTRVARRVIADPETLDPATVLLEPNVEVRRVMIERIGYQRLFRGLRMKPVAKDKTGRLWRVDLPFPDEPIVVVEVENATKERDGSRKRYFLRVPPDIRTACDAVAWTFGIGPDNYQPSVQT